MVLYMYGPSAPIHIRNIKWPGPSVLVASSIMQGDHRLKTSNRQGLATVQFKHLHGFAQSRTTFGTRLVCHHK